MRDRVGQNGAMKPKVRVAYVASMYPAISHTFIRREVVALRERGVDVEVFSIRFPSHMDVMSPLDIEESARIAQVR